MHVMMTNKLVFAGKTLATNFAFVRSFSRVTELVGPELILPIVLDGAIAARKLSGLGVSDGYMLLHVDRSGKFQVALCAWIWLKTCVYAHMVLQIIRTPECFRTHFTSIWTDFFMAANMSIKLMLHIKFSTALWATEGPGGVVRVVNLFMGQQGTFNFEHFPAFVT